MVGIFGAYEVFKTLLLPDITLTESHILSTVVVVLITFIVARYILHKQEEITEATELTNRLLQTVLSAMQEGILIVDRETMVTLYNRASEQIFHLPPVPGQRLRLVDVTRDPAINEAFRRVLDKGGVAQERFNLLRGEPRHFQVTIAPLEIVEGRSVGAVGVFVDITRLERLERVRQDFFANLSHELRTPLTAILAHAETLRDGAINDPDNSSRFLEAIHKQAQRMHILVRDITDLAEIESGEVRLKLEHIELRPLVEDVIALILPRAEEQSVTILNDVSPEIRVLADPTRLEQILNNLIDNGVKFNRPGGKVWISARREDEGWISISVRDTGVGIPPADQPRVFERFYRTEKSRSRDTGGSGLGLAIVKHLVQAHGGALRLESRPDAGSEFIFTLKAPVDDSRS